MRFPVFGFLLFLPLILYFLWAYIVRRKMQETEGKWDDRPLTRLFIAGLLLMAAALIIVRFTNEGEEPTPIVPSQYEDDRFIRDPESWNPDVPGQDTPADDPAAQ